MSFYLNIIINNYNFIIIIYPPYTWKFNKHTPIIKSLKCYKITPTKLSPAAAAEHQNGPRPAGSSLSWAGRQISYLF